MLQQRLWPLRIVDVEPVPPNTARLRHRGLADDGHLYYLKSTEGAPLVPATELLCSGMAAAIGLAVPAFAIALWPETDEKVFASRAEAGLTDSMTWFHALLAAPNPGVAKQLSAWFAFDLFINNEDRHINNFLCRNDSGVCSLFGFDFSEAFLAAEWPPPQDLRPRCNTLQIRQSLSQSYPLNHQDTSEVLERVRSIPDDWMDNALSEVPNEWLDDAFRARLVEWWVGERSNRAIRINEEISNGKYA